MQYECIKNVSIDGRLLYGAGYALARYTHAESGEFEHKFTFSPMERTSFVFGFHGVGHHYRGDLHPAENLIVLHLIRDGVPIYLQHASIDLSTPFELRICWTEISIRIFKHDSCFINILGEEINGGRWGFAVDGGKFHLPEVTTNRNLYPDFKWIVFGDGYSNNRWKNRHFFSWPELAFGHRAPYLNACVAAGNTRRVLEIIDKVEKHISASTVLVAAGADDFIENTPIPETLDRLTQIVAKCKANGAASVLICAIPPRGENDAEVAQLNGLLRKLAEADADGFIDFHAMLSAEKHRLLVGGDFPGAAAQEIIAHGVIKHLGLAGGLAPLSAAQRQTFCTGKPARCMRRLATWLARCLGRIPTPGGL